MSAAGIPDLEMGLTGAVQQVARAFAAALAATPQFLAFEQAHEALQHDEAAQRAGAAYQDKQQALQMMLMLNAVSPKEQAELERLREAFFSAPSVVAMLQAQEALQGNVGLLRGSSVRDTPKLHRSRSRAGVAG